MDPVRDPRPGDILGERYRIVKFLHKGSYGTVFQAKDLKHGEPVAIKVLTKKCAVNEEDAEFAIDNNDELEMHQMLGSHPNIVSLRNWIETNTHLFLILDFCEGGDLYESIQAMKAKNITPPTELVRSIMEELINAVEYCHVRGVYHRDIKPENILITFSGITDPNHTDSKKCRIKLGDFGLCTTESLSYETAVGSDRYMSPEQYESEGAAYSPAQADIWAIGIVLINLLFGSNPWETPSMSNIKFRDFARDIESLADHYTTMTADTVCVLKHCLALDPSRRSLTLARHAVLKATAFVDDVDDLELASEKDSSLLSGTVSPQVTVANREPLDTPVTRSPVPNSCAFWPSKAQRATPQPIPSRKSGLCKLAASPATSENLMSKSSESNNWSSTADTINSVSYGSTVASDLPDMTSVKKLAGPPVTPKPQRDATKMMGCSLPIDMVKSKNQPSFAQVFMSQKLSRSWSEDVEAEEEEAAEASQAVDKFNHVARRENNARTFSTGSASGEDMTKVEDHHDFPDSPLANKKPRDEQHAAVHNNSDSDLPFGGFELHPPSHTTTHHNYQTRVNAVLKRGPARVNWDAIGERRRAFNGVQERKSKQHNLISQQGTTEFGNSRQGLGHGHLSLGMGAGDAPNSAFSSQHHHSSNHYNFNRNRDFRFGQARDALDWRSPDCGIANRYRGKPGLMHSPWAGKNSFFVEARS